MAFGLGKAADGGFATDTPEECRQQAIEILTLPNMVNPMDDPSRAVFVQRVTDKIIQLQQVGLDVWNMLFVETATGANLDKLASNIGLKRKPGSFQTLTLQLTSINVGAGYTIPANTTFVTIDGKYQYTTFAPVAITSEAPVNIPVQATRIGGWPVMPGDKLVSQTYIPQLSDVMIESVDNAGLAEESDEDFRFRFFTKYLTFIGTLQYMLELLRDINNVYKVGENHNNTAKTDADGVPPYSTEFLILPVQGADEEAVKQAVAQKILNFMLPGLPTYGQTSVTIPDYRGRTRTVNFTLVSRVPIEIFYRIKAKENGEFSESNVPEKKQAIVDYVTSLNIGTDISVTDLWGIVAANAGFDVAAFGIRRVGSPDWQQTNLTVGLREAATVDVSNIIISLDAGINNAGK